MHGWVWDLFSHPVPSPIIFFSLLHSYHFLFPFFRSHCSISDLGWLTDTLCFFLTSIISTPREHLPLPSPHRTPGQHNDGGAPIIFFFLFFLLTIRSLTLNDWPTHFVFFWPVSLALRENTYPFLALIVLRDNKMTVVLRIEGAVSGESLIERVQKTMSETEGYLVAMRMGRQERNLNNTLRQEQDEAYRESLRQDQEKVLYKVLFSWF